MLLNLRNDLKKVTEPKRAKILSGFFKTGKGQYGEGDVFLGITVPNSRKIAQKYKDLSFSEIQQLLKSKIHEERLVALLILVDKFQTGTSEQKEKIYNFYLKNTKYINNWDLVDLSADKIVGEYLLDKSKEVLFMFSRSENLWEKRIAIIATYQFIKNGRYDETLRIAKTLLHDEHDLIQKAVGWMLREVGKRCSQEALVAFLKKHYKIMPRTTLRYAIEHFPEKIRRSYIEGKV